MKPLPTKLQILNWGTNESSNGPVILDDFSVGVFAANQKQFGFDRVALDFEHNTVPGTEEYNRTKEPRAVAAFGTAKIIPGQGLYIEDLQWTPSGQNSAANYEDLSAAPMLDTSRRVIALHSAALTRLGAVYNLPTFTTQTAQTFSVLSIRCHSASGIFAQSTGRPNFRDPRTGQVDMAALMNWENQETKRGNLAAFSASPVDDGTVSVAALPTRVILLPWGQVNNSAYYVSKSTAVMLPKMQAAMDVETIQIVLNPQMDKDGDFIGDPTIIGTGKISVAEGIGIVLEPINWDTTAAPQALAQKPNFEPIVWCDHGIVVGVRAVTLTDIQQAMDIRPLPTYITLSANMQPHQRINMSRIMNKENLRLQPSEANALVSRLINPESSTTERTQLASLSAQPRPSFRDPKTGHVDMAALLDWESTHPA